MYQVLMEAQPKNFNIFTNKIPMKQSAALEEKMAETLRENGISTMNVFFNTYKSHKGLVFETRVTKYDYIWKDDHGSIIAFWDHRSKQLMF